MRKIGLLSDTHGDLPEQVFDYFSGVDEIWHAGDIGDLAVTDALKDFKPLRAVYGNIDDQHARLEFKEHDFFTIENVKVVLTHIGGRPGNLSIPARELIKQHQPKLFICGHSHILLVKFDSANDLLWLNPGACGNKGFHHMKTLLRFSIDGDKITNMEAIEIGKRSAAKQF